MPTPSHLVDCVARKDDAIDESPLEAGARCPFGATVFDLLYLGRTTEERGQEIRVCIRVDGRFFSRIKARCTDCGREHLLFDKDFHGWNGFVCHKSAQAARPRPLLVPWTCLDCGATRHQAAVLIETQGQNDFAEETDGDIHEERWPNGFSGFSMGIECAGCGRDHAHLGLVRSDVTDAPVFAGGSPWMP